MMGETLLPAGWRRPSGYANGMKAAGTVVVTAGQVGWDADGKFPDGFVEQVAQTLRNVLAVLEAGDAGPEDLVRLTWYVTDIEEYRRNLAPIGRAYREILGKNFPAMAVVAVAALVESEAKVEIEATAVVPSTRHARA